MEIAKCKFCEGEPKIEKIIPVSSYDREDFFCGCGNFSCNSGITGLTESEVLSAWNCKNTDQHGQQLSEMKLTFVEWDGDVEHLPPEGSDIVVLYPDKEMRSGTLFQVIDYGNGEYQATYSFYDDPDYVSYLRKGDQFAVVEV